MRIGLVTSRPDHPLLAGATAVLTTRHEVTWLDPERGGAPDAGGPLADVYLLKARTPAALALARRLEERGAPVLNTASATGLCQDRVAMARVARAAGLPFVATEAATSLARLAARPGLPYPLVVKSRHSRRDDLVARVDGPRALRALLPAWRDEPVVVQPFTANSGWDHKVWVIGGHLFSALRRSELADDEPAAPGAGGPPDTAATPQPEPVGATEAAGVAEAAGATGAVEGTGAAARSDAAAGARAGTLAPALLPDGWAAVALRAGEAFALDVYGVDLIDAGAGSPLVVDVNAFPGARGQAGASEALAALALRAAEEGADGARSWRLAASAGERSAAPSGPDAVEDASPTMSE